MRVGAVQRRIKRWDKQRNLEIMVSALEDVKKLELDLVAFGELFLTGYTVRDRIHRIGEPLDGPSVRRVSQLAEEYGTTIVFGMPEKDDHIKGLVYNSSVVVCPDGRVDRYRKFHLPTFGPFEEGIFFAKGKELHTVDTPAGRLGLIICYDIFFPEISKYYALSGADVIVCISASPNVSRRFFEHLRVSRAIENAIPFVYANLIGTEDELKFWGGSAVVAPTGRELSTAPAYEEGVAWAEITRKDVEYARANRPTLRDTRDDVFEKVLGLMRGYMGSKL